MGGTSRYDRSRRTATGEEDAEARALHAVARLLDAFPQLVVREVMPALANVLDATAIELANGRPVNPPVRIAVRRLARELQRRMRAAGEDPPTDVPRPQERTVEDDAEARRIVPDC